MAFADATNGWIWTLPKHEVTRKTGKANPPEIYRTSDSGVTWLRIVHDPTLEECLMGERYVSLLDFINRNVGWAVIRNADDSTYCLLRTLDGGEHWAHLEARIVK